MMIEGIWVCAGGAETIPHREVNNSLGFMSSTSFLKDEELSFEQGVEAVQSKAIKRLVQKAVERGANAILNVSTNWQVMGTDKESPFVGSASGDIVVLGSAA
ncbi:MAG: heavy metal-binding domain-containing protein [Pseudomonadota bacterium]|nr:heavy metal-binding domain-containing protein [Pseudomonadota bacterium]